MKKQMLWSGIALFFSFLFFSCDKQIKQEDLILQSSLPNNVVHLNESFDLNGPFEHVYHAGTVDESIKTLQQLRDKQNELRNVEPTTTSGKGPTGGGGCDCQYRIIDIGFETPSPTAVDWNIEFINSHEPSGICSNQFNQQHIETGNCTTFIFPQCIDDLDLTPDPFHLFDFRSPMPRYASAEPISFNAYELDPGCLNIQSLSTDSNPAFITFQIFCNEINAESTCLDGQGYGFAGPIVTMDIETDGFSFSDNIDFSLEGECGCTPTFN